MRAMNIHRFESLLVWMSRYVPGQKFGRHIDESVEIGAREVTLYTLLIYLSGAFPSTSSSKSINRAKGESVLVGGETVFYGN